MKKDNRPRTFDYAYIDLKEEYNYQLHWDIVAHSHYSEREGHMACHDIYTPLKDKTKRKAIKELVALGGERTRKCGKLRICFSDENKWNEAFEYMKSLQLMYKLANGE